MNLENFLTKNYNLSFKDLYDDQKLEKITTYFEDFLTKNYPKNSADYFFLKSNLDLNFDEKKKSEILINLARNLEEFLAKFFNVEAENKQLKKRHEELKNLIFIRREFVQKTIARKFQQAPENFDFLTFLKEKNFARNDDLNLDEIEKNLAEKIYQFHSIPEENLSKKESEEFEELKNYCAFAIYDSIGKKFHKNGALFILPKKIDHENLVNKNPDLRKREGFNLTDSGFSLARVQVEANYCIFCHKQEKDSCRVGLVDKETSKIKIDPLGIELNGCPLQEKISEMNLLKSENFSIASLAIAMVDNPMIAGTGHRICNDCMKSCIYQKQDPVDIPQIETTVLKDVLALPYGFEIYSLLTRWNPLKDLSLDQKLSQKEKNKNKKNILICGLGPAGYSLAHYMLNEGHNVVAIDGLKIEPLNSEISGIDEFGIRKEFRPIKFLDEIYEPLSTRLIQGFGGVAEYGITVRWDKNFLKIIRLLLERRQNFKMFGGIRFGSTITPKLAFEKYNFDHIALCIGAGRPNIINLKNNFAKGVRSASDFLMALQLTGAFKEDLFTNLQVRMPAIVVGGGLTAIDTASEVQAYYLVQIQKFVHRLNKIGKKKLFVTLNKEEKQIAEEFIADYEKYKSGDFSFLDVKVLYRNKIQKSPAYRLNHEELNKALEEGIKFIENISPIEAVIDEFGHIKSLKTKNSQEEIIEFSAKSLMVAAGTSPNISPVLEDNLDIDLQEGENRGKYFKILDNFGGKFNYKNDFITKIDEETGKSISFFGDLHPKYEGNVVKAMASAKNGYQEICRNFDLLKNRQENIDFWSQINSDFLVKIDRIERLTKNVVEIFIKAPILAQNTEVGQIFRLHNYHILAKKYNDQTMAMEGVAVTALFVDKKAGIISGIVVETGGSTSLIHNFKNGEPCIFMGPSGKPTDIPKNEVVAFVGGGRGNQPLTALAEVFSQNGCEVLFFAGYKKNSYIVRQERMEKSAKMIFAIEEEPNLNLKEKNSAVFKGTVIEAIKDYFCKNNKKIDRVFTIANNRLMHEVSKLRSNNIVKEFAEAKLAITSLNAPMQCMLKGVCSQCLQKRKNEKGEFEYFYSCADQDQNMDNFDFEHLHNRCDQNSLSEKLSKMWIEEISKN